MNFRKRIIYLCLIWYVYVYASCTCFVSFGSKFIITDPWCILLTFRDVLARRRWNFKKTICQGPPQNYSSIYKLYRAIEFITTPVARCPARQTATVGSFFRGATYMDEYDGTSRGLAKGNKVKYRYKTHRRCCKYPIINRRKRSAKLFRSSIRNNYVRQGKSNWCNSIWTLSASQFSWLLRSRGPVAVTLRMQKIAVDFLHGLNNFIQ